MEYSPARLAAGAKDYELVYKGQMERWETLDSIYSRHNRDDRPNAKTMRSVSVSDIIVTHKDNETHAFYVQPIGYKQVDMLIVISTFALDFIHSDRSIFKIVDLDEAWAFLNVAQGETLSNKLVRAGRAMQAGVYFVTQSAYDVSKESLKNNIGLKFAFRSTDINEIKQTLEFFGIDKDDENNQKRLRDLENGQCLLQDLYGRVGVVQIHPVFEELLHAFDTRPPVQRNEVE